MGDFVPQLPQNSANVARSFCQRWPPAIWKDLHVAVALSGGCDSTALVRMVLLAKEKTGGAGKVVALHINHQLRGEDSDADARWCQELCDSLGVECRVLVADTCQRASTVGDGLEAAAREQRYDLLTSAAEEMGARYLAMAHTRDDQVETILFRLLRGSGLRGLRGIPQSRQLSSAVTLVRPLLDCSRQDLEEYLKDIKQDYRTDATNQDVRFTRNRLRHDLLPKLRSEYNTNVDTALLQLALQAEETDEWLEAEARALLKVSQTEHGQGMPSCYRLEFPKEVALHLVLISTAIRIAWREVGLSEQGMTYSWWQQLAQGVLSPEDEKTFNLPGDVRAEVAYRRLVLEWSQDTSC